MKISVNKPIGGRHRISIHLLIFVVVVACLIPNTTPALQQPPQQTHGQASGDITDSSAILWTRASRAAHVTVDVSNDPSFGHYWSTEPWPVSSETDFTVKARITDLEPSRRYYYRFILRDVNDPSSNSVGPPATFVTAPDPDEAGSFTFAWSGDTWARFQPFRSFSAMKERGPDFFLYLGDTIYGDVSLPPARTIAQYRKAYKVNRGDEDLRTFLETTSTYVIWDDHEVQNNFDGTHPRIPIGRQAFLEYWPIQDNEEDPARLYRSFRWGTLAELFILDTRQYRSPGTLPDTPSKTMLGEEQKVWLKTALVNSPATFKVIATSVPLRFHGSDSWEGYTTERQELFDFIAQYDIRTLVFLSADVHYAGVINHPEGFKEVFVGPIGQFLSRDGISGRPETEFSYNRRPNFGLVRVLAEQNPAVIEILILDEENNILHTTSVTAE